MGISIECAEQSKPEGSAQAFTIGRRFVKRELCALVLGDSIFHGQSLSDELSSAAKHPDGATVFAYRVQDPQRYGVVQFDAYGNAIEIEAGGSEVTLCRNRAPFL